MPINSNNTTVETSKETAKKIRRLHREYFPLMKKREFMDLMADVFEVAGSKLREAARKMWVEKQLERQTSGK